jgi:hypothetical protein
MWTYNGIRITVVDLKETSEQILAKLQPIDAGTVYQSFGYINDSVPLQGYVVGREDIVSLKALAKTGVAYTLSGYGYSGSFYLDKITAQWMTSYGQTFRPDKDRTELVFKVALELSEA